MVLVRLAQKKMLSATPVTMVACMALLAGITCMMQDDTSEASRTAAVPAAAAAVADAVHTMSVIWKTDDMQFSMRLFAAVSTAASDASIILMLGAAACCSVKGV